MYLHCAYIICDYMTTDAPSNSLKFNEQTILIDSISKVVYELRELESIIMSVRQEIRNHDDRTIKFYEQNAKLTAEIDENNGNFIKLNKLLNEITIKETTLCVHLNDLINTISNKDDPDKEWSREQIAMYQKNQAESLKVFQKVQSEALKEYQAATRAMIWKMLGIILAFAAALAGLNGVIHL